MPSATRVAYAYLLKQAARPSFQELKDRIQSGSVEFLVYKGVVRGWLVHYTYNARDIMREGFRGVGNEHLDNLGWTWNLRPQDKEVIGGYSFAYLPKDALSAYGLYGYGAIVFQARGVKVYNENDGEEQVVFVGSEARNLEHVTDIKAWLKNH